MTNFLTAILLAAWIGIIAVFSIQNITAVSLKFLAFESIQLPVGVLLAFSMGIGTIVAAIASLLWRKPRKSKRYAQSQVDDLEEFDF